VLTPRKVCEEANDQVPGLLTYYMSYIRVNRFPYCAPKQLIYVNVFKDL